MRRMTLGGSMACSAICFCSSWRCRYSRRKRRKPCTPNRCRITASVSCSITRPTLFARHHASLLLEHSKHQMQEPVGATMQIVQGCICMLAILKPIQTPSCMSGEPWLHHRWHRNALWQHNSPSGTVAIVMQCAV